MKFPKLFSKSTKYDIPFVSWKKEKKKELSKKN